MAHRATIQWPIAIRVSDLFFPTVKTFATSVIGVRVTVEGRLLLCLGNEHSVDLKAVLRQHPGEVEPVEEAIRQAIAIKPEKHHFDSLDEAQIVRFMNMTGG